MNTNFEIISQIIRHRRSVYPHQFKPGLIAETLIDKILENGIWSPNHKMTQPWRYIRIQGKALLELSNFLADWYKSNTPADQFSEMKWKKAGERPLQSAYILAICISRSPTSVIPEWEETAALAMSVQNIWLSCAALNIGAYWSTPGAIKGIGSLLNLTEQEECLGLFFMGWAPDLIPDSTRIPVDKISRYL